MKYLLIAVGVYWAVGSVAFCIVLILIRRDASTRTTRTVCDLDLPAEVPPGGSGDRDARSSRP